jgi:hypothetical protein
MQGENLFEAPKEDIIESVKKKFIGFGEKANTSATYSKQLVSLCELVSNASVGLKATPESLLTMTVDEVEDLMEEHCHRFNDCRQVDLTVRLYDDTKLALTRGNFSNPKNSSKITSYRIAPKRLNTQLSALKLWLLIHRKLKNRKQFREIKFEKNRTVESSLSAITLETRDIKKMFQMANGFDIITLGFYGLDGLRPSLIPQLKVRHLHPRSYKIENGSLVLLKTPPLLIIPTNDEKGAHIEGNKASIEFPVFIPTQIATRMLNYVNGLGEAVTLDTRLCPSQDIGSVNYTVRKHYEGAGFNGKPYRMRNFASQLLKNIETKFNDADLKEFMLGHKPQKMSFIYDFKGLPEEVEAKWRSRYVEAVDGWINENIFMAQTAEDLKAARMLTDLAAKLGDEAKAREIFDMFEKGNMSTEQLQQRLSGVIQEGQDARLESKLDLMIEKKFAKKTVMQEREMLVEPEANSYG